MICKSVMCVYDYNISRLIGRVDSTRIKQESNIKDFDII